MNLQFKQQIAQPSDISSAAIDISFSPSQNKIAVLRYDRQIQFYNEQFQPTELIQTRGIDHTKITDTYLPICMSWSSDSTMISVGQSDMSVYIYNIGTNFEKKSIIGKCIVSASVSSICWLSNATTPMASDIIIGCSNGDVWIYNVAQKRSELLFGSQAMQRLNQSKTSSIDKVATGNQYTPCSIINIHQVSATQALIVNQMGVGALLNVNNLSTITQVSRNNTTITTSCLLTLEHSNQIFLASITSENKIIFNSLSSGLAVQQIKVLMKKQIPTSFAISTGSQILLANQEGIIVLKAIQSNPLQIKQDQFLQFQQNDYQVKLAANNNGTNVLLAFTNGKIDCFQPIGKQKLYCNCQLTIQAPNKQILEVKGFKSERLHFTDRIEFQAEKSSEIIKLHAYPEDQWKSCLSANKVQDFQGYIAAKGDKSIVIYSFKDDLMVEIEVAMNVKDKLFFDVGERNIIVISRADLAEFQPFAIIKNQDNKQNEIVIQYPTIKQCCSPGRNLISCHLQQDNTLIVCHLGGDRNTLIVDQLQEQANIFDDFVQPITTLQTYQLQSIPDWIDLSPSGQLVLIRSINGSINVASTMQQCIQQISTSMGNRIIFWVMPYDVLAGQEPSDTNILVYYSPLQSDVKPQTIQIPNGKEDSQLVESRITKKQQGVQPAEVSLVISNSNNDHETLIPLQTDILTFTSLLQNKQAAAACLLLSRFNVTDKSQWQQLLQLAYSTRQFNIISRCLVALNMIQKSKYATRVFKELQSKQIQFQSSLQQQAYEKAQVALLQDNLNEYDHYMQQADKTQIAIDTYINLKLFDRAVALADPSQRQQLQMQQLEYYKQTKQSILAAQLLCQQQDFNGAVTLLLQDQAYISAYNVINRLLQTLGSNITNYLSQALIQQCAEQLEGKHYYALAGDLYASQALNRPQNALQNYKNAKLWQKALTLAQQANPAEVYSIECEYAQQLVTLKQYSQAAQHYVNGNMLAEAIKCYLKAQDTENSSKLLQQSNFDYNTSATLKLQLASILFQQNKIDDATKWFMDADQPLLAVQALLSIGEFDKAIQIVKQKFQGNMQKEVIKSEAQRILNANKQPQGFQFQNQMPYQSQQYNNYNQGFQQYGIPQQQTAAQMATQILQKICSLSTCYGPQAAVNVYTAAQMYDDAIQLLKEQQMLQELILYVDKINYDNYTQVYEYVASQFQLTKDLKNAAQTLERLCYKLQKDNKQIHPYIDTCVQLFVDLKLFDQAIQVAQNVNENNLLIMALINKVKEIPTSQQAAIDRARALKIVDDTALAAVKFDNFDFAIKLAEFSSNSDDLKHKIQLEQGTILQRQGKYQDADRCYQSADAPLNSLQMWLDQKDFVKAEGILNNSLAGNEKIIGQKLLKQKRAAVYAEQQNFQEAEKLYCELGMFSTMVQCYQQHNMWKEALQVAKMSGDPELKESVIKGRMVQCKAIDQSDNLDQTQTDNQQNDQNQLLNTHKTWQQQLIDIMEKQDKQLLTNTIFQHLQIIADKVTNRTIQQSDISEDELMLKNLVDLSEDNDIIFKAITIITTYITKGVPKTIQDKSQPVKSCIQLILGVNNPIESIISICTAVLSLEYTQQQFVGIMGQTASDSSAYSICKQLIVNYKLRICQTAQYQQQQARNPCYFIATSQKLSRCFEALQLLCHLSQLIQSPQKTATMLRDLANLTGSLCRYIDLLPVDRCFYMAAQYSQQFQELMGQNKSQQYQQIHNMYLNQSGVFYNTFLDIIDLQPQTDITTLDLSPYKDCNIQYAIQQYPKSPSTLYIENKEILESTRQYIMQQQLSSNNDFQLPTEKCPFTPGCQQKIWICDLSCKQCGKSSCMCCLTGLHTTSKDGKQLDQVCKVCGCHSRKNQWNQWLDRTNSCCVCGELATKQ